MSQSFAEWVRQRHSGELCTHGPKTERQPMWLIKFEDTSCGEMHFDNEPEAVDYFLRASANWNCTLFVTVRIP